MPSPTHHTMAKMDRRDDAHGAEEDLLPEHMQASSAHEDEHRIRSSVQHSTLAARTPAEGSHCSSPERAPRNASPSPSGCREALRSERSSISAMVRQSSSSSSSRVEAPNYQTCQPSDAAPSTTHKTPHTLTYVGDLDLDEVDDPLAIPRRTSTLKAAAFHIFKGNVGAGVFLLPAYYQDAGYVLGALLVIVLGLVMIDCSLSLLRAKRRINDPAIVSYPAVVDYVLGPWFRLFTQFSLIFTHFGFCVIYVQYAASMFAALFTFPYAYQVFVGVCVCVVTPITFLTHRMQLLGYVSFTAGLFIAVVLAGTTYLNLLHLWEEGPTLTAFAFIPGARLAVFLSGHMFSLEGIGVLLPVENSLSADRKPKLAKLVECLLMSIVVLYITFGILGYIAFGQSITTSVVLALPPSWMKYVLQVLLGLSLILGYPIQYVPAIEVVDGAMGIHIQRDRKLALVVRTSLNLVFGVVAMCIGGDTINIVASFLGAFVGVHFMITIPSLLALQIDHAVSGCQSTMSYPSYLMLMFRPPWPWSKLIRFGYLVFALIIWCSGLYFTASSVFASA